MQEDIADLNCKKIMMLNQFKKDHENLKGRFDRFIRSDVTDMKSLQWDYEEPGETEVQEPAAAGSDQEDQGLRR